MQKPLILRNSAPFRRLPWLGLAPTLITGMVSLGLLASGTPFDDLKLPLAGMLGLSAALTLVLTLVGVLATAMERGAIARLAEDHWTVWPQFAGEDDWQAHIEHEHRMAQKDGGFPFASLFVLALVFAGVLVATRFVIGIDLPIELLFGMGGVLLVALLIIIALTLGSRQSTAAEYRRQRAMQPPRAFIGKWGIYDEGSGYSSLYHLKKASYLPPGRATDIETASQAMLAHVAPSLVSERPHIPSDGWAQLHLYTHQRRQGGMDSREYITLRVPPGLESMARQLVQRYETERIGKFSLREALTDDQLVH